MSAAAGATALGVVILGVAVRSRVVASRRLPSGVARTERTAPTAGAPHQRSAGGRIQPKWIVTALLAITATLTFGPVAVGGGLAVMLVVRRLRPIRTARRRQAAIEHDLPAAMDLLVLSVRAGLTPFQAVRELATSVGGPIGEAFGDVVRRTERGQPFADALGALGERLGVRAGGLADVIATSDRHGLPLGPVLDQLSAEVRAARLRLDQASARRLPVQLSFPLVMFTLPSFVLLAIAPAVLAALSSLGGSAW